jgi:serine/threonine-protein kinase
MLQSELRLGGRYRLDARIGAGGMGEVWRAVDEVLGRVVAVKAMLPEVAGEPGFARRFLVEAKAMASVNHPAVASIHDYGHSDGITFLVMEFIDGESLSQVLGRHGRLAPAAVMRLVAQAADGLQAVHDCGIVHRDIKPANLLIRRNGALLITDFGISRTQHGTLLTASGAVLGTPTYLSPEQVLGQPATARSDVYSLGLVAYECLAGRRPFEGENAIAVALQRIQQPPPALSDDVPRPVLAVVEGALATDPAHRWPSAAALADAARSPGTATGSAAVPHAGFAPPLGPGSQQGPSSPGTAPGRRPPSVSPAPWQGLSPVSPAPWQGAPSVDRPSWQGPPTLSPPLGQGPSSVSPPSWQGPPSHGQAPGHGPPSLSPAPWQSPPLLDPASLRAPRSHPGSGSRTGRRLIVAGFLVVVAAVVVTAWMMNRETSRGARTAAGADPGQADTAPSTTASPDALFEQAGLAPCGDVFCPTTPMCWGGLTSTSGVSVTPRPVDCAELHYWETFAVTEPPGDVATNSEDALMERPDVAQTCSAELMSSHSSDAGRTNAWEREAWLIEVPGTKDRLLHCLAYAGDGEITGSAFIP